MRRVGLVGCGAAKLQRSAPARDLYIGDLFRKASAYAEAVTDSWFVLSALHGLVDPDLELEPYDVKLGGKAGTPEAGPPIHEWATHVAEQLQERFGDEDLELVVLAGEQYRTILWHVPASWSVVVPLKGLGIGQQKSWLKRELEASA